MKRKSVLSGEDDITLLVRLFMRVKKVFVPYVALDAFLERCADFDILSIDCGVSDHEGQWLYL